MRRLESSLALEHDDRRRRAGVLCGMVCHGVSWCVMTWNTMIDEGVAPACCSRIAARRARKGEESHERRVMCSVAYGCHMGVIWVS